MLTAFIKANIIALSLAGVVRLMLELGPASQTRLSTTASFHNGCALVALGMGAVIAISLLADVFGFHQNLQSFWIGYLSLAA